jgi:two-component system response regulator MprA
MLIAAVQKAVGNHTVGHAPTGALKDRVARVLVVEDDAPIAALIADKLRFAGHMVDVVANGADALEFLNAYRPDAIVLDLMMPRVHGWDFIERHHRMTGGDTIPIVVVSAAGAVTRSMEEMGVRRFLPKPFHPAELVRAVEDVL